MDLYRWAVLMSGIQQMLLGGGGDTEIVGVAYWSIAYDANYGFSIFGGTITDGKFAPCGGAPINSLYVGGIGAFGVQLVISGDFGNSGFEIMTITNSTGGVTVLYRNDATFSSGGGGTNWSWPSTTNGEFGANGTTATVVFS